MSLLPFVKVQFIKLERLIMENDMLKEFREGIEDIKADILDLHRNSVSEYEFKRLEREVFIMRMVMIGLPVIYLFSLIVHTLHVLAM